MQQKDQGNMSFNNIHGANIIVNSTGSTITVSNAPEQLDHVSKIIEVLKTDSSIKDIERIEMLELMFELKSELKRGPVDTNLLERIASVGSNIATIATYLHPLLIGFGGS